MRNIFFNPIKSILLLAMVILLFSSCGKPQGEESLPPALSVTESPIQTSAPSPSSPPSEMPTPSLPDAIPKFPVEWGDNGIFSAYYDKAYERLETMTLEEKIGQLLLIRCPQVDASSVINKYKPGGIVLFEVDFKGKTADEVIGMIAALQNAANVPMIMATDEEGGSVVRISRNTNLSDYKFQSPQKIYNSGGFEAVRSDTLKKAALLKKLGLNLNLAPVADISVSPSDFIYARSFGRPAAETGEYVTTVVAAMREMNLSSALKHFPGYGNNADTHTGVAVDNRPLSAFSESDFIPFKMGIDAGAESILVSHNIINNIEEGVPASLSKAVHRILRNHLRFTGIIMTDDLSMAAVNDYTRNYDPAVLAVLAGNDMLLLDDYNGAFTSILAAVKSEEIPLEQLDHAVFRILSWKLARGIIS